MDDFAARDSMDAAQDVALDTLDISEAGRFEQDTIWPLFARMRDEDPLHYCPDSFFGPYWSVTRYDDIMAIDTNHRVFSSTGGITLRDPHPDEGRQYPMFIATDQPRHTEQRKTVSPSVAPDSLAGMEDLIRKRVVGILESLPPGEPFNWVDRVSIELTTQMLATLFDFPFEDRRLLPHWSDVATSLPVTEEDWVWREKELGECLEYFTRLWNERIAQPPRFDLISMMAHSEATREMNPRQFLGNLILLIVGGNDTTRNSITGGLYFLNKNPGEYDKLRANPGLVPNMVSEIIRYQTPLAYMKRRALEDFEMHGKTIREGDKVAMWYISGNRDPRKIEDPDRFWIDRPRARQHLSFGFGIHRCMGNRLAEMQLRILWEEILKRYPRIDVLEEPKRVSSSFVHGYESMKVEIPA